MSEYRMSIRRLAVLMTSFNRRDLTLRSLSALYGQRMKQDIALETYLVEDACTDGTAEAVHRQFPMVRLLHGNGSLYWNGGMRLAFAYAMRDKHDAYLLLNDDTILYSDALHRLWSCAGAEEAQYPPAIVVGSTKVPGGGPTTYGGLVWQRRGLRPYLKRIDPDPQVPVRCDTMNGNCALIPQVIAHSLGNLEARFQHQFGDWDYGLRAQKAGFTLFVAPGYIGECAGNSQVAAWRDPKKSFRERWRSLNSPKGVPFREWSLFTYRYAGWFWPLFTVSPYIKVLWSGMQARISDTTR